MNAIRKILNKEFSPELVFLILGPIFGLLFLVITPPFQAPDEFNHFYRSFQISEGQIVGEKRDKKAGGMLPRSFVKTHHVFLKLPFHPERKQDINEMLDALDIPLDSQTRVFISFENTVLYSPVPYIPQALAIFAGRMFDLSPIILVYLGRFSNLAVWIFLIYLAIKSMPFFKWVLFLLALTPMSLSLAASLSADSVTNSLAFLLCAVSLKHSFGLKERIITSQLFVIFLLSILLCLCKQGYAPLVLLVLLIPAHRFGSLRNKVSVVFLLLLLCAVFLAIWNIMIRQVYVLVEWADPASQLDFLLTKPFEYLKILFETVIQLKYRWFKSYIGVLGWLDTELPGWLYLSYYVILIIVSLLDKQENIVISFKNKALIAAVFFLPIIIICTMMFVHWNTPGAEIILVITGRYFIPVGLPFFLLFYNKKIRSNVNDLSDLIVVYSVIVLSVTCFALITRYY